MGGEKRLHEQSVELPIELNMQHYSFLLDPSGNAIQLFHAFWGDIASVP